MALNHAKSGEVVHLKPGSLPLPPTTAALVKCDRFEAVRLVVPKGTVIPAHRVAGYLTLYCLEGHIILEGERGVSLHAGDWVYLDRGISHAVRGEADSALLLTIMFD